MTFSQTVNIASGGAGQIGGYQFRANSLFDPDFTGTGVQPNGFDELSALFNWYRVTGCAIKVMAASQIQNQLDDMIVVPTTNSTLNGDTLDVRSQYPYCKRRSGNFCQKPVMVTNYVDIAKMWGVKKDEVRISDGYSSTVLASPDKQVFWSIQYQPLSRQQTSAQEISVAVELTYYATFFRRNNLDAS